jgi:NAD(P)-dependent dehydrogenase (short-subunit alcohol dehydrogenase family)
MYLEQNFSLSGQVAFVVGASRGIGRAIAEALAGAGAHVILSARGADKLEAAAAAIRAADGQASAIAMDVTKLDSIESGVRQAVRQQGRLDILVNVSGVNIRKRMEDYTVEEYDHIINTNLRGIFQVTQRVGAAMKERRKGKIISIASLTSLIGFPYLSVYAASKGAISQMSKVLAVEWAPFNIQVNAIAPGFIVTDLNRHIWERQEMLDWLQVTQANPRPGTPEDVAGTAVFLASRAADYITGQVIYVDGGHTCGSRWPFEP